MTRAHGAVWLLLLSLAVLMRLPFFWLPLVNWDESAYLIVGQDMARGFLPYRHYWTLKPPLGFAFFGAVIAAFGPSIFAIRLAGSLWLGLSACVVYHAGGRLHSRMAGIIAGLFVVLYTPFYQRVVLMELVALLPLSLIAYWLCIRPLPLRKLGLAVGCAVLIRTNLGALLPALWAVLWLREHEARKFLAVTFWASLPVAACTLLYWQAGLLEVFFHTMVDWSLGYSQKQIAALPEAMARGYLTKACVAASLLVVGMTLYVRTRLSEGYVAQLLCFAAVLCSIYASGAGADHYFVQVLPFLGLILGVGLCEMAQGRAAARVAAVAVVAFLALAIVPYFWRLPQDALARSGEQTPVARAAAYVSGMGIAGKYVYAPQTSVLNFLTETLLPTTKTHHINAVPALAPDCFFHRPDYVVTIAGRRAPHPDFDLFLQGYRVVHTEDDFTVYEALP